jgi:hypothetical protein
MSLLKRSLFAAALAAVSVSLASAGVLLTEGFNDVSTLSGAGWVIVNNSSPVGTTSWFQGDFNKFPGMAGATDNSYVAANYLNAADPSAPPFLGGDVSDWLITPQLSFSGPITISFYTRTETGATFPDRLEVLANLNNSGTNVGSTATSTGDFTLLLTTINDSLTLGGYPENWTQITTTFTAATPLTGRIAFRYAYPDNSTHGNLIGIDTLTISDASGTVPEPATAGLMLGSALAIGLGWRRRVRG